MNFEEFRIRTFRSWPADAPVDAFRIANGGFFYTGQGMEVQCFACGGKISEWNEGDHVMAKHRRLDPRCPFIVNPATSDNVPKHVTSSTQERNPNQQNSLTLNNIASSPNITQGASTNILHTNSLGQIPSSHPQFASSIAQNPAILMQNPAILAQPNQGCLYSAREIANLRISLSARLNTFTDWPITHIVTPLSLALAGFYSVHEGDKVKCATCNGIVGFWENGDEPKLEHRRHFPTCPYVLSNFNLVGVSSNNDAATNTNKTTTDLTELGIQTHKGPRQVDYATVESRLRTFSNWPLDLMQTPEMLSEAGFYYVGTGDQVRCFHCDGGLRHWDPQDEPWIEHARWFPNCAFLRIVKGAEFIKTCAPDNGNPEIRESRPKRSTPIRSAGCVTEEEIQSYMSSEPVITALGIGIDIGRVKNALRYKIEYTGTGFACADSLIEAAFNLEIDDPDTDLGDSEASEEVSRILSSVLMQSDGKSNKKEVKVEEKPKVEAVEPTVSLEEENRLLKEAKLCKICMDSEIGIVFLPCGHLTTCVNCAPSLKDCPVCRSVIKATVRTFLS